MKSKTRMGNILLAAGALFLAAALLLTGSNLYEAYQAGQASERLSQEVRSRIESQAQEADSLSQAALAGGEEETPEYLRNPEMEMPVEEIEGNGYIGLLEIPALGLSLPVMSEWSYPNLKLAPCRYNGSAYTGNFTIAGHNYSTHFGPIGGLNAGCIFRPSESKETVGVSPPSREKQVQVHGRESTGVLFWKEMAKERFAKRSSACHLFRLESFSFAHGVISIDEDLVGTVLNPVQHSIC